MISSWIKIGMVEMRKGFLLSWGARFNLLSDLLVMSVAFIGLSFLLGQGQIQNADLPPTLIGYLIWFYALMAITNMSWDLREETQTGTLEQLMMSPTPPVILIFARFIANFIITTLMVIIIGVSMALLFDIHIPMRLSGIPVLIITQLGVFGFVLIIAGATLVFKHVEAFASLSQNTLIFLNGALLPITVFPTWLEVTGKLLPTTLGIIALRGTVLEGLSLWDVIEDGSLPILILHSVVFVAIGVGVFQYCERVAKRRGTLGQY